MKKLICDNDDDSFDEKDMYMAPIDRTIKKKLGKIQEVYFGQGGYQDAMIGISFTLGSGNWSVGDFWGYWSMKPSATAKWNLADQTKSLCELVLRINKVLEEAKVCTINDLKNIPIEVSFIGDSLVSWRILTEVL